ncbi:MAG: thioredoxin domain-containing protein [Labilithrix sp.]|nr:thioredoxin domain-containing protein [Labilithrix sp.]
MGRRALLSLLFLSIALAAFVACSAQLPSVIRDELERAPRGTVTIVFFTDFQCPFCRRTHVALAPLLAQSDGRVKVVLRHVPLKSHPDARTAARAAVCGEQLGARSDFAHALFTAPDLGETAVEEVAVDHGADRARFRQCVVDPATDARIDRDTAMFDEVSGDGVPLLYVGKTRLEGGQSTRALEVAIEAARAESR